MNTRINSYKPNCASMDAPKIKTVGLQFSSADHNLEVKIKAAFDLAKSGGRELDLIFSSGDPGQRAFRQLHL
jgi:hypothetical protein